MNAFDKHSKNFTAWCENCDEVFDRLSAADSHANETHHKLRITEFWITERR
jgi:hypothetical protein